MTTENWHRITSKAEYLVKCADVFFGDEGGSSIATTEGEICGKFGDQTLSGSWDWDGDYFYRTSMLGKLDLGSDWIVIDVTATKMRLTLEKGNGPQVVYDRKDAPLSPTAETDEIVFLSSFDIKHEAVEEFTQAMIDNQTAVRAETGSLEMRLFQGTADKSVFFVFGRTDGQAGLAEHIESVSERGIEGDTNAALNSKPIARHLGPAIAGGQYLPLDRSAGADEMIVAAVFDLKPGTRDALVTQYEKQVPNVRAHSGCLSFNAYTVLGAPDQLAVVEIWESEAVARAFSTTDKLSVETGKLLMASVDGDIGGYLSPVTEIAPYVAG